MAIILIWNSWQITFPTLLHNFSSQKTGWKQYWTICLTGVHYLNSRLFVVPCTYQRTAALKLFWYYNIIIIIPSKSLRSKYLPGLGLFSWFSLLWCFVWDRSWHISRKQIPLTKRNRYKPFYFSTFLVRIFFFCTAHYFVWYPEHKEYGVIAIYYIVV